ncbi:hypothetical protein HY612_04220 [Candidatus Roizmanbacteria bacterium]|nr:hypothetical protein [Candidatus Roizmanbacteria bacterium]
MDNTGHEESEFEQIKNMSPGEVLKNVGVYGVRTLLIKSGYPGDEVDGEIMGEDSNIYGRPSEATPLGIIDGMIDLKIGALEEAKIHSGTKSELELEEKLSRKISEEIIYLTNIRNKYKKGEVKPVQDLLMDLQGQILRSFLSHIENLGLARQKYIPGRHKKSVELAGVAQDHYENVKVKLSINKAVQFVTIQRALSQIVKPGQ